MPVPCSTLSRRLEDISKEFTGSQIGIKKGAWGESRLDFESIVEEVRRFVARMPPADSTTGLACCLRNFYLRNKNSGSKNAKEIRVDAKSGQILAVQTEIPGDQAEEPPKNH